MYTALGFMSAASLDRMLRTVSHISFEKALKTVRAGIPHARYQTTWKY